ncbi:MAG: class I SAM-dependent methyltransferase [Candidatus Woesearchaeota archaeon]|jgi:SAM-dependent methyltransferase
MSQIDYLRNLQLESDNMELTKILQNCSENLKLNEKDIPMKFNDFCDDTNNSARNLKLNQLTPRWIPISNYKLWNIIQQGETQGYLKKGMKVLDLGGGTGSSAFIFSYNKYNVISIELNHDLATFARTKELEFKSKFKDKLLGKINFLEGSYYSEEYISQREKNPEQNLLITMLEDKYSAVRDEVFFPVCVEDVYKKNKINFGEFDVIYAYLWDVQTPSVIDMCTKYAKEDAVFIFISHLNLSTIRRMYNKIFSSDKQCIRKNELI